MSKKNKNFNKEFVTDAPEIISTDEIGYMPDELLQTISNRLESERSRVVNSGRDPLLWEVEIAYLRREQDMRKIRNERHAEYLQKFSTQDESSVSVENEDLN
jgi:hypothetical protein